MKLLCLCALLVAAAAAAENEEQDTFFIDEEFDEEMRQLTEGSYGSYTEPTDPPTPKPTEPPTPKPTEPTEPPTPKPTEPTPPTPAPTAAPATVKVTIGLTGVTAAQVKANKAVYETGLSKTLNLAATDTCKLTKVNGEAVRRRLASRRLQTVNVEFEIGTADDSKASTISSAANSMDKAALVQAIKDAATDAGVTIGDIGVDSVSADVLTPPDGDDGLSGGAIAGIVIACFVAVGVVGFAMTKCQPQTPVENSANNQVKLPQTESALSNVRKENADGGAQYDV